MATSRQALGIEGETVFRVPSLSLPDAVSAPDVERWGQYEALISSATGPQRPRRTSA